MRRVVATIAMVTAITAVGFVTAAPGGAAADPPPNGYWLLTGHGGVFSFGLPNYEPVSEPASCPVSPLPGRTPQPNGTCWSMTSTPKGHGFWIINSLTGAISRYGDAGDFGSPKAKFANTSPEFLPVMRQIVSTPSGLGYWVYEIGASGMGRVDHYGDAGFFGDTTTLVTQHKVAGYNGQPVGIAKTPDGKGYWEVYSDGGAAADGGVFAFGDARFEGSMSGKLHRPIIGIARPPEGGSGYWLASSSGEIFTFGNAPFNGTLASTWGVHDHVYAIVTKRDNPNLTH